MLFSFPISADESSSSEAAGEKTDQNEEDSGKSQEVWDGCLLSIFPVSLKTQAKRRESVQFIFFSPKYLGRTFYGGFVLQSSGTSFLRVYFITVTLIYCALHFVSPKHFYRTYLSWDQMGEAQSCTSRACQVPTSSLAQPR